MQGKRKGISPGWDADRQKGYIRSYCRLHQRHEVLDAVSVLFKHLPEIPKKGE
jgi:hypothetical protein